MSAARAAAVVAAGALVGLAGVVGARDQGGVVRPLTGLFRADPQPPTLPIDEADGLTDALQIALVSVVSVVTAAAGVLLVVLLVPVLRMLAERLRALAARFAGRPGSSTGAPGAPIVEFPAETGLPGDADQDRGRLARAAAAAARRLGTADDLDTEAVIRCWEELEAAAAELGGARAPTQTPSEFTSAVLRRFRVDEPAVATLLEIYGRARFAGTLAPGDADRARAALSAVTRGLAPVPVP